MLNESEKINLHGSIHSGEEFHANGVRLRVQFRPFGLNPQHFIDQTFEFATAFLYAGFMTLKFLIKLSGVKSCTSL